MSAMREDRNLTQMVIGLGVLAAGAAFTLDNMGVIDAGDYLRYWPVFLVAFGLAQIVQASSWSSYIGAVIWMLAGLWFLGRNVGLIRVSLGDLWPLGMAAVGVLLVLRGWRGYGPRPRRLRFERPSSMASADAELADDGWVTPVSPQTSASAPSPFTRDAGRPALPPPLSDETAAGGGRDTSGPGIRVENTVNAFVIMGGISRRMTTQDFKGGNAVAIMGGAKIDLREASIAQGEAVIDVVAFWGGIEIKVPEDWIVSPQVFPFMGGFDDRTGPPPTGSRKRLVVRGLAFMGGVEVKH